MIVVSIPFSIVSLTPRTGAILYELLQGKTTIGKLAEAVNQTRMYVQGDVQKLKKLGYIKATGKGLTLTEAGKVMLFTYKRQQHSMTERAKQNMLTDIFTAHVKDS